MAQIPYNWKHCSTCAYWCGARSTNIYGERVELNSTMDKGKCMCRGSGWFNREMQASHSCQSFKKWEVLK